MLLARILGDPSELLGKLVPPRCMLRRGQEFVESSKEPGPRSLIYTTYWTRHVVGSFVVLGRDCDRTLRTQSSLSFERIRLSSARTVQKTSLRVVGEASTFHLILLVALNNSYAFTSPQQTDSESYHSSKANVFQYDGYRGWRRVDPVHLHPSS